MSSKSDVLGSGYFQVHWLGECAAGPEAAIVADSLLQGGSLLAAVVGAAVLHFVLHLALLELVPVLLLDCARAQRNHRKG